MNNYIYDLAKDIASIPRSLCGPGVRRVLNLIQSELPQLEIRSVKSGSKVFDWTVPKEWDVNDAYILTPVGRKIASYWDCPLHLVQHSEPTHCTLALNELKKHLHISENIPTAIPYVTSYYRQDWGFCISANDYSELEDGNYEVVVDTRLFNGNLNYGELFIQGNSNEEILISTYICHPYMGNNEASGPAVAIALANKLKKMTNFKYSLRFLFIPETIGSLAYLNSDFSNILKRTVGGVIISCVGDEADFSLVPARKNNSFFTKLAKRQMSKNLGSFNLYDWLKHRGSDERQFCWPSVDLDVISISRSKYNEYDEYHTSADDMNFINEKGLNESYQFLLSFIQEVQSSKRYLASTFGEPHLGKLGLYRKRSLCGRQKEPNLLLNILAMCDGYTDVVEISDTLNIDEKVVDEMIKIGLSHDLLK